MGYIYKVTNLVNGKMYIGQTKRTIEIRWGQHVRSTFRDNDKEKCGLHRAIRKYGLDNFIVEQVEECTNKDLNARETYWIKYFDTLKHGYNHTLGGEHPFRCDGEEILPLWNEGYSVGEIADRLGVSIKMVSDRLRVEGVLASETTARAKKKSGITSRLPVYLYDRDGNYFNSYNSIQEAAEAIGYTGSLTGGFCYSECTVGGYQWRRYKVDKLKTQIPKHEHEVHQYTIEGGYIASFKSLREAAKTVNGTGSSIGAACRGKERTQAYGYRWSFDKMDKLPPMPKSKKCRPVIRISEDGTEQKEYPSVAQASRENRVSYNAIHDACIGIQQHSAGYYWKYADAI